MCFFLPPFSEKTLAWIMLSAHEIIANVYYPLSIATKIRAMWNGKTLYLDKICQDEGIGLVGEINMLC